MAEPKSETNPENNNNNPFFFLSLIPKFLAKPFNNFNKNNDNNKVVENGKSSVKRVDSDEVSGKSGKTPDAVKFPRTTKTEVSSIKLESEDAQQDTNPLILWQVYALGGFIILKWAWGKWQERKARGKDDSSGAEQPPPSASDAAPPSAPAED